MLSFQLQNMHKSRPYTKGFGDFCTVVNIAMREKKTEERAGALRGKEERI